ncbi:unnamed protein product [Cercopithifilaria johnstoni]|uniref:Uncharacterized protein n=1 Tax=Cercopithifilaria johnstoni TaxID=2874296 RepID=A0A8J2Q5S3_9BILA|nr:unnamed protein product [Cercopithifilaria johnstoni]
MISRRIAVGILLLITINILAIALVDGSPSGYARPSDVKGNGDGARMYATGPSGGGPSPRNGEGYGTKNGKDGGSGYYKKGAKPPHPSSQQPSAKYEADGDGRRPSYGRPEYR